MALRKLSPEDVKKYKHEERLDYPSEIANYLGISEDWYRKRYQPELLAAGILFRRSGYGRGGMRKIRAKYFTYKRLVIGWLIKRGGL